MSANVEMDDRPTPEHIRMPATYGLSEAPGADKLPWSRIVEWLTTARTYWVCSTRPDGRPHAMPVWGLWLDGRLSFSTDPGSRKGRNLAANPEVVVHLESGDDVCILEGVVARETDPEALARFVDEYERKYTFRPDPSAPDSGVYVVRHRAALSWLEKDFPETATRWRFAGS